MCTKFGVYSSSHFPFKVQKNTDRHTDRQNHRHHNNNNKIITVQSSRRLPYRVDVVILLLKWFVVLNDGSEVWQSGSHFEYLLQLFVGINNDHATLGTVRHVPARIRRVRRINTGCQTPEHSFTTIDKNHEMANAD